MITTIDPAGRLVIPKGMRNAIGMTAGNVQLDVVGSSVVITVPTSPLEEREGLLFLSNGVGLDSDGIREMRLDLQR